MKFSILGVTGALAAALLFGGCEQKSAKSAAEQDPYARVKQSQQESKEALDKASDAQRKAMNEQKDAEQAQSDVQRAQKELQDAQAKAQQETEQAKQAQQQAQTEASGAQQVAAQKQQEAQQHQAAADQQRTQQLQQNAQQQEQNAQQQQAQAQPAPAQQPPTAASEQSVSGELMQQSSSSLVIQSAGGAPLTLSVNAQTQVTVDGAQASIAEIPKGAEIRATYRSEGGNNQASRIEAETATGGSGAQLGSESEPTLPSETQPQ